MWKTEEGSSGRLIQLCLGYFFFYVITGVAVRYFQYYPAGPKFSEIEYLVYNTLGAVPFATLIAIFARWYHIRSTQKIKIFGIPFPKEILYIVPSGVCTAIIVTFTTLMYSIPGISVMVAMVLMRASVIIAGRIVDAIQIKQGILHKKVYWEEDMGVIFAVLAVMTKLFWTSFTQVATGFNFITHPLAMTIFTTYVLAYGIRIYLMNYFKNTRPKNIPYDYQGYFYVEQVTVVVVLLIVGTILFYWGGHGGMHIAAAKQYYMTLSNMRPGWWKATVAGIAFGGASFFAVFIFMFKGRTATFAGLVNRLTSLLAGILSTFICWYYLAGEFPEIEDWISLAFILISIVFITRSERRRVKELLQSHEIKGSV